MGCSQGANARLLVEPGAASGGPPVVHTFDASSEIYDFLSEDIGVGERIIGGRAITGSRSQYAGATRLGHTTVGGNLRTYTSAGDLDFWLPRILGAAEAANVFDVSDSLATNGQFGMLIDRVGGIFQYVNCFVDKAYWRAQAGPTDGEAEVVEQVLSIVGTREHLGTSWPGSPPTFSAGGNRAPLIMADAVLTVGATPFYMKSVVILVDNQIQPRWVNSITPTALCPSDRIVMVRAVLPFTAAADAVFGAAMYQHPNQATGVAATIVFTHGSFVTTFTFTSLQWVKTTPQVRGKTEIVLQVDFQARKTDTASELVVTNVS